MIGRLLGLAILAVLAVALADQLAWQLVRRGDPAGWVMAWYLRHHRAERRMSS